MTSISERLGQKAREREEKTQLSDRGMAMDREEIPHGAEQDSHDDEAKLTPAHHDD